MRDALAHHDALIEELVAQHGGAVVRPRGEGDSRFAVFANASAAVASAAAIQVALGRVRWDLPEPLRVRIAIHTGEADVRAGDYYGTDVNRCARIRSLGYGGQVLISGTTAALVRDHLPIGVGLRRLGPYRLKDLTEPETLFQLLHAELPADFSPLRSAVPLSNVPVARTTFIDRQQLLAETKQLVATTHLVTLAGPGGVGKTRLALQLASDVLADFPDGVWLAELAALSDAALVTRAVAGALGVAEQPGRSLVEALAANVRDRRLLLVLDNCEHLVAAAAALLDQLLRMCPGLWVITTSREPLGLAGEVIVRVPPLEVPDAASEHSVESFATSPAVQLFTQRAQAVQPHFVLNGPNAQAVASVCRRLDGLPLAIELAAARVRVISLEQIAHRLDAGGNRFLVGGSRATAPRQQTLQATLDWSYELLSEDERRLFQRLSVFTGSFDLEAVEAVCSSQDALSTPIIDLLSQVLDKSLIVLAGEADGEARYRLLETIRRYARERLVESGEFFTYQPAHARYYLGLAEQATPRLTRRDQRAWLERLDREHDNLHAALAWAFESEETDTAMRLGASLWRFWRYRGYLAEAESWLNRLLALPGPITFTRLHVLFGAAMIALRRRSRADARLRFEQLHSLAVELHHNPLLVGATIQLGHLAVASGDDAAAERLYTEALTIIREPGRDPRRPRGPVDYDWESVVIVLGLATLAQHRSDTETARRLGVEALDLARQVGDEMLVADALRKLGDISVQEGSFAMARARYDDSLRLSHNLGLLEGTIATLEGRARLATLEKEPIKAMRLFGAAAAQRQAHGYGAGPAQLRDGIAAARAALDESAAAAAWSGGYGLSLDEAVEELLAGAAGTRSLEGVAANQAVDAHTAADIAIETLPSRRGGGVLS